MGEANFYYFTCLNYYCFENSMNADVFDVLNADKHFLNDNAMILLDAATLNS